MEELTLRERKNRKLLGKAAAGTQKLWSSVTHSQLLVMSISTLIGS